MALEEAIRASFDKVNAIAAAEGTSTTPNVGGYPAVDTSRTLRPIRASVINTYVTRALARYNGTTNPRKQPLEVIMEEKYIASFGMGIDLFTDWRRTAYPVITVPDVSNIGGQPGLVEDQDANTRGAGLFPRRLFYSQRDLQSNVNPSTPKEQVDPLSPTYRIFWDR
jgi:hypothetical protein